MKLMNQRRMFTPAYLRQHDVDPSVRSRALGGGVRGHRVGVGAAFGGEPLGVAELACASAARTACARALRERKIGRELHVADRDVVAVAEHADRPRLGFERLADPLQQRLARLAERRRLGPGNSVLTGNRRIVADGVASTSSSCLPISAASAARRRSAEPGGGGSGGGGGGRTDGGRAICGIAAGGAASAASRKRSEPWFTPFSTQTNPPATAAMAAQAATHTGTRARRGW